MLWKALERLAASDRLRLLKTRGGVTIFTTDVLETPLVTITIGELTDEDADTVLRKLTKNALDRLRELGPG